MPRVRRSRAEAEDRRGGRGVEERGSRAGEGRPVLEERDRQGATHPLAASRSAGAAFPRARVESSFVWDGVQEIDTSFVCFTLTRRA